MTLEEETVVQLKSASQETMLPCAYPVPFPNATAFAVTVGSFRLRLLPSQIRLSGDPLPWAARPPETTWVTVRKSEGDGVAREHEYTTRASAAAPLAMSGAVGEIRKVMIGTALAVPEVAAAKDRPVAMTNREARRTRRTQNHLFLVL